jgi:pyruvate ferredoxin oxidoreductase delta subunit
VSASTDKKGWKAFPHSNVLEAATSLNFKTGAWATEIPVWNQKTCISCLNCWVYCPDDCWEIKDGKNQGVNLDYCKGCGICVNECPTKPKSISMTPKKK